MYRVELKVKPIRPQYITLQKFLMYRVELKGFWLPGGACRKGAEVPNVPCGVERKGQARKGHRCLIVPNVPCGVESSPRFPPFFPPPRVPNVPCGVERFFLRKLMSMANTSCS